MRTYSLAHIARSGAIGVCPDCLQARAHLANCPNRLDADHEPDFEADRHASIEGVEPETQACTDEP